MSTQSAPNSGRGISSARSRKIGHYRVHFDLPPGSQEPQQKLELGLYPCVGPTAHPEQRLVFLGVRAGFVKSTIRSGTNLGF
jgi:hypothetical protein